MTKKKFEIEDTEFRFAYSKSQSNLNIEFNRISFIFFIFFIIFLIYSIHLIHLGSRKSKIENNELSQQANGLFRDDIIDRNGNYLVKTVSSTDIGISSQKVIDKKKLLLNLKYIFPKKDYIKIESNLNKKKFF